MEEKIKWYQTPVDRQEIIKLTKRSDLRGFLQAGSFLLIYLALTALALYFYVQKSWVLMVISCYIFSVFQSFVGMGAAIHELSHKSPFKTKWINEVFYHLFAFLTWVNPIHFRESHMKHHQYTTHKGLDYEVIIGPILLSWKDYLSWFTFDYKVFKMMMWANIAHFFGKADVDFFFWKPLLPEGDKKRKKIVAWARFMIIGHLALIALFAYLKLYVLIYTVSFSYFFGTFLIRGTEIQQHLGLLPNVPDWRLSAWSIHFHPILAYLYWNMNYHIDHHMYAGVPFYNVPKLHKLLEHDLPKPINGYLAGIRKILDIQKKQKQDPNYQYMPEFPETANPPVLSA